MQRKQCLIEDSETIQNLCEQQPYRYYYQITKMEVLTVQTKFPKPIDTMIKSVYATNLSLFQANMTSTGLLSAPPVLDSGGGEPLFDETTYEQGVMLLDIYDLFFYLEKKKVVIHKH